MQKWEGSKEINVLAKEQKEGERLVKYMHDTSKMSNISLFKVLIIRMSEMNDTRLFSPEVCSMYADLSGELYGLMNEYKNIK